jgi:small subunit ribosomal protein S3
VGRKGENIQKLTAALAKKYKLENLQIEISEVPHPNLDPRIVAERIAGGIERFGIQKFKAIAHRTMNDAMNSGAAGIEIVLSGKVPSSRARSWRFYKGYLKKSGEIAEEKVAPAYANAHLKLGTVGVRVRIMPSDIQLPDDVKVKEAQ